MKKKRKGKGFTSGDLGGYAMVPAVYFRMFVASVFPEGVEGVGGFGKLFIFGHLASQLEYGAEFASEKLNIKIV